MLNRVNLERKTQEGYIRGVVNLSIWRNCPYESVLCEPYLFNTRTSVAPRHHLVLVGILEELHHCFLW